MQWICIFKAVGGDCVGFRFIKSVKLGKGVKLNLGKRSAGISFGGRRGGVSINSRSGARGRVSVPGTGISYSTKLSGGKKQKNAASSSESTKISTIKRGQIAKTGQGYNKNPPKKLNPPKPPKSPKIYFPCGIVMVILGVLMLFLFWPLGLITIGIGVYYITCGPKIYANLVANYKAVHPDFEENIQTKR